MLEVIAKEIDTDEVVQIIDTIEVESAFLVCYMTGNEYQAHSYWYAEFAKQGNNYRFQRTYPMMNRGVDLCSANYMGSYLFISNNEKNTSLSIHTEGGDDILIQIDTIPFVYFWEDATAYGSFEYSFLDENDEELR